MEATLFQITVGKANYKLLPYHFFGFVYCKPSHLTKLSGMLISFVQFFLYTFTPSSRVLKNSVAPSSDHLMLQGYRKQMPTDFDICQILNKIVTFEKNAQQFRIEL